MKRLKYIAQTAAVALLMLTGCRKDFLDKKPDQSLLVPTTLGDFQAILDNSTTIMNYVPYLSEVSTDDIYTTNAGYLAQGSGAGQNSYIWAKDIFQGGTSADWNRPYQQVFYSNIVLDGLRNPAANAGNQTQYDQIKGMALFERAFAFYQIAQEFSVPYYAASANQDLGIPLRLTSDVTQVSKRSTVQQTYDQIILDLTTAANLLPAQVSFKTRPTQAAAQAMLARVYQTMGNFTLSAQFATKVLQINSKLIDYNTLSATAVKPIPASLPNGNDEVLYYAAFNSNSFISGSATLISADTSLYSTYAANDLRKTIFFKGKVNNIVNFKGSYTANNLMFAGIATDEIYLIRAEAYARAGDVSSAMSDLNTLLKKRWKTATFISLTAPDAENALALVLMERRKELVYRNLRWTDLRRLNSNPRFAVTLTRHLNGQTYTLPPGDPRYTFPIPDNVIATSGIPQNPR